MAIFRGEQFDRSKPLLRQAEIKVGFNHESDIQDIETTYPKAPAKEKLKDQSDIQDVETRTRKVKPFFG